MYNNISCFRRTRISSISDANSGHWQVEGDEHPRGKTSFTIHRVLYQFTDENLPADYPATCPTAMNIILGPVNWTLGLIYWDGIVVFPNVVKKASQPFPTILQVTVKYRHKTQSKMCSFFGKIVNYLGLVICHITLKTAELTEIAILYLQNTTTILVTSLMLARSTWRKPQQKLSDDFKAQQLRRRHDLFSHCVTFFEDLPQLLICGYTAAKELVQGLSRLVPVFNITWKISNGALKRCNEITANSWATKSKSHYTVDSDVCDKQNGCVLLQRPSNGLSDHWYIDQTRGRTTDDHLRQSTLSALPSCRQRCCYAFILMATGSWLMETMRNSDGC